MLTPFVIFLQFLNQGGFLGCRKEIEFGVDDLRFHVNEFDLANLLSFELIEDIGAFKEIVERSGILDLVETGRFCSLLIYRVW